MVVNFWATWCVPCIQEIPSFNKLHQDFAPKGSSSLGIGDGRGRRRARPALPEKAPDGLPGRAWAARPSRTQYNLDVLPVTLVFDRTGKQIKRFDGLVSESDLEAAVQSAL